MREKIIKIESNDNVCIENLSRSNINIDCTRASFDRRDYRYARKRLTLSGLRAFTGPAELRNLVS